MSTRLERYVRSHFGPDEVEEILAQLLALGDPVGRPSSERVMAGVVLAADGHFDRFTEMLQLARIDWRDVLVAAGLADDDWLERLDEQLGPR